MSDIVIWLLCVQNHQINDSPKSKNDYYTNCHHFNKCTDEPDPENHITMCTNFYVIKFK